MDRADKGIIMTEDKKGNNETKRLYPKLKSVNTKAEIEWQDADGKVTGTQSEYRSLAALFTVLSGILAKNPEDAGKRVEVFIPAKTEEDKDIRLDIAKGTLSTVVDSIGKRCVPPGLGLQKIQLMIAQVAEASTFKGLILTAVFDDGMAGGYGIISDAIAVTDEDMIVLGEAAESQVEMFKDAMHKKRNISFPSDSTIITPGGNITKVDNLRILK